MTTYRIELLYDADANPIQASFIRFDTTGDEVEIIVHPVGPFDELAEPLERIVGFAKSCVYAPTLF